MIVLKSINGDNKKMTSASWLTRDT
jgi:hypothetical protein